MKSMKQVLRTWALATVAATALWAGHAHAAPTVFIDPPTQDIAVGQQTSVDIVVSGLTQPGEAVGGFGLILTFDDTILKGLGFVIDPGSVMGNGLDLSLDFVDGSLDLFYVADANNDQGALAAAQGASFTLATVSFEGLVDGLSPVSFVRGSVFLSNWNGDETIAGVGTRNGEICVGGNCSNAPEPASMVLVGTALGALALLRRRRSASPTS